MDLGIRGRKAIVAGGSAGMGKESALALANEGVNVFLSARGEARLQASAQEISSATGELVYRFLPSRPFSTRSGPGLPGVTNKASFS